MIKEVFCIIALLAGMIKVNGQSITGTVTGQASGPITNASVHLLNTQVTVFTDKEGNFMISKVPAGTYTIQLTAVGYAAIAETIIVKDKAGTTLNFKMQNALVQLEAVIITAQKKEELLQNVPLSVTAISSKQVEEFRLWNSKGLTAIVPNLYSGNSGDERNVTSIRGITTTSYDPAIATYIDGVNQFSLDTYIPQLSDIESIEVLRGPQGTLYGRNAMGGVINITTKQPADNTSGFAEINIGNYGQQRYSAGIRTAIIKGKLFAGISGVFDKRNGYYTNGFNNTSFDRQHSFSGNYYLKYLPGKKWAITLNAKHQDNRNNGAFPMVNGVDDAFKQPFEVSQDAVAKMIDNTFNASLSVTHAGAIANVSSQTAFQQNQRYYDAPLDGDFSPADAVTVINNYGNKWNNVKVFTQEFKFNSPAKSSLLNWTAGTYFFHQSNPSKQATHFGKDAALVNAPDIDFSTINTTKATATGVALYGQVNYMLTKKLTLIAGLRYDHENKKLAVKGEYRKDSGDIIVTTPDTSGAVHYNAVSPKFGLAYQLNFNSKLFATYSRGYRTGGLTQLSSDPSQPPLYPYLPEYSNNVEAGIKNNFLKDRLSLNVTFFYTYVNNAQVPTLILPDAITVTKNTGQLHSKGAETELLFNPVKGLQASYNFGYTDATYKSLKVAANGQTANLQGKKQIFTPAVTSMFAVQYSCVLIPAQQVKFIARAEWFYLGRQYFDLANTIEQSSYSLLNTRLGVSTKHAEIFFWARNFTNKKYIEYAYDFGAVHLGNPATFGITFKAMF